jgi:hypothetical protein
MNGILYRGYGGLFSSRQPFAQWLWDGTKAHHSNVGLWCRPGALNIGDGGGKEKRRLLGCGLEKRPPYPRLTELAGDAPRLGAGSFTKFHNCCQNGIEGKAWSRV